MRVHAEGHFQLHKFEEWGEVWEEWKWKRKRPGKDEVGGGPGGKGGARGGAAGGAGSGGGMTAKVEAKWTVTSKDKHPPRPNLHMKDESRGMEMNLTPEACFYRYPKRNDSYANWTLMTYGYWM